MSDRHIDLWLDILLLSVVAVAAMIIIEGDRHKVEINQNTVSIHPVNRDTYCNWVRDGKPHYKIERDCR